jgi:hypothetical protein
VLDSKGVYLGLEPESTPGGGMGKRMRIVVRHRGLTVVAAGVVLAGIGCGGEDIQAPATGSLEITTATSGPEPDNDGYSISIDHGTEIAIAVNATMQRDDLEPGSHSVQLGGLAANCIVAGENPRTINVPAGEITTVSFQLTCSATTGGLQITSATSGPSPDPDGYTLSLDGSDRGTLAVNGAVTLEGLTPGSHAVGLSGIVANCQVEGENPRTVTVTAGATVTAAFAVVCAEPPPVTGSIRITTSTTGPDPDANGYAFAVDGGSRQPIGVNATTTIANVSASAHTVRLSGVAANCSVQGNNPRSVTVANGATADLNFAVACTVSTGALQITTTTTGPSPDPDGYTVSVDGGTAQPIGINATLAVSSLGPGTHTVALAGLTANCQAERDNPRTVNVTADATTSVGFAITCSSIGVTRWTSIPLPQSFRGTSIWASSPSDLFVTGYYRNSPNPDERVIVHYDGRSWTQQFTGGDRFGDALWGISPTDVFAVVGSSEVLHYDGAGWVDVGPRDSELSFQAIWGASPTKLFVGAVDASYGIGWILHYDGARWQSRAVFGGDPASVRDISGTSPTDVYAIGSYFSGPDLEPEEQYNATGLVHYDGNTWGEVFESRCYYQGPPRDCYGLSGVWANASNDVFVVGSRIFHYNGTAWSQMTSPTSQGLVDVWGNSSSNVYAVGAGGIFRYDGRGWALTNPTPGSHIWGTATDLFVLSEGTVLHGHE